MDNNTITHTDEQNTAPEVVLHGEIVETPTTTTQNAQEEKFITKAVAEIASQAVAKVGRLTFHIADMQQRYQALTINGLADNQNYLLAVDGAKIVKKMRTSIEAKRKELNEFPLKFQRTVNAEAKRLTELLTPIEDNLKRQIEAYENEEKEQQRRDVERKTTALVDAGFKLAGAFYVCGIHMIPVDKIAEIDEDRLAYFTGEARMIVAAEQAAEQRRRNEIAQQQAEAEALRQERAELAREREELAKLKAELEALKNPPKTAAPVSVASTKIPGSGPKPIDPENIPAPVSASGKVWGAPESAPEATDVTTAINTVEHVLERDLIDQAIAETGHSMEYIDGFEHCRQAVLDIFADPAPRKRGEFVEAIKQIKP